MTSVPPGVPTFTLADIEQIVALAVQIALVKAQGLPPANNCPIVNLTPVTAFWAQNISYFDPDPSIEAVKIKDNHSVYHNVFSFTN